MHTTLFIIIILCCIYNIAFGQQVGTLQAEVHPPLSISKCRNSSGCTQQDASVVLDANWRWTHDTAGYTNCFSTTGWNSTYCPDPMTCAQNCALEGANYVASYGVQSEGDTLALTLVTKTTYGSNVGSRVYLMANESSYYVFNLLNQEFTFDVDVSELPCGLNGALYFVEMDGDGGMTRFPSNKAGAQYGTGYCDAQCPRDLHFIDGEANSLEWNLTTNTGEYGSCCVEMDIWEANSAAAAFTPHPCTVEGQTRCSEPDCGATNRSASYCDMDGCDFNSYRMGDKPFYGVGGTGVDTSSVFTVVTQFITSDGTASGDLSEIRRFYVQDGKVIENSATSISGMDPYNSISDKFCAAAEQAFEDENPTFLSHGGLGGLGAALGRGVVLVLSLWDDTEAHMLWLDSDYPLNMSTSTPGVERGPCATSSGVPSQVESEYPGATVRFSNLKWGEIGSTFGL